MREASREIRTAEQAECAVRVALDAIKGRWKPSILFELKDGPRRFSEIQAALGTVSAQALTAQLRQLERDGIIARAVFESMPVRVEYRITDVGASLARAMDELESWGTLQLQRSAQRTRPA